MIGFHLIGNTTGYDRALTQKTKASMDAASVPRDGASTQPFGCFSANPTLFAIDCVPSYVASETYVANISRRVADVA